MLAIKRFNNQYLNLFIYLLKLVFTKVCNELLKIVFMIYTYYLK